MISTARISLLFLCALLSLAVYTQESKSQEILPAPTIVSTSAYGFSEGLPSNCLDNVYTDSKGRLWANPCAYNAVKDGLSFFQYDGKQAIFVDLTPPWPESEEDRLFWSVLGETTDGFLFGVEVQRSLGFWWHPDTKQQYFFQLAQGEKVLNMVAEEEGKVLLLSLQASTYRMYSLRATEKKLLDEITLPFQDPRPFSFPYSLLVQQKKAYFFHQEEGLIILDLRENQMEFHPWGDLKSALPLHLVPRDAAREILDKSLSAYKNDQLLLFMGVQNGFYVFDPISLQLEPHTELNLLLFSLDTPRLRVQVNQDAAGNYLINAWDWIVHTSIQKIDSYWAFMLDESGKVYDYTPIIKEMSLEASYQENQFWAGQYFSPNFKEQVGGALDGGLVFLELQPQYGIETYPFTIGARTIVPWGNDELFLITDAPEVVLDLNTGTYRELTDIYAVFEDFTHPIPALSSVHLQDEDRIWLASSPKLIQFDKQEDRLQSHFVGEDFEKFVFLNEVEVLLFTTDGQLFSYNVETKTKQAYHHHGTPFRIESVINEIHLSPDGLLWVAARNGLWCIDLAVDKITQFNRSSGWIDDNIMCIHEAADGTLWVGTAEAGLLLFDPIKGTVKQIAEVNGLSNNTVVGIVADADENRWVSTFNGISVLSPQGEVMFDLHKRNGLTHDEFNRTSYVKLPDGRMAFGGVEGLNIIDPKKVLQVAAQKQVPTIFLTKLEYYNPQEQQNQVHYGSYSSLKPLSIPATHRYLTLDFALSDFLNLLQHTYSYRIIPLKSRNNDLLNPWMNLGPVSELSLNNLPVGDWLIQVRGIDHRRNQVTKPLEIPIHVAQFFYRTWWFYALCAFPFLLGAWVWLRRILTERKRLSILVEARTAQIQKDKEVIEQQAEALRSLDETKSRFFTNISHEFRTPLTIISGMASKIHQNPNQWLTKGANMIQRNADELLNLVNQILDLRKLEAGKLEPKWIQGNIVPFLNYISESFHSMGVGRKIKVQFLPEMESLTMDYDPEMILRIVSNLLSNAIKYSKTGGVVELQVATVTNPASDPEAVPESLLITVRDEGVGIPETELPHIFDRFYQVDDSATRQGEGTGVGLSLTRELIRLLEGSIDVQSKEGSGSTFSVCLPIHRAAPLAAKPFSPIVVPRPAAIHSEEDILTAPRLAMTEAKPELLIIEDNADVRQYLTVCLQDYYQLSYATDGARGIEKALDEVPDIIISDVMMPNKDGFAVCDTLKQDVRTSHIPIILLTAKSDADSRISGLQRGADAYLAKPFNEKELLVRLEKLLELRKTLQARYQQMSGEMPTDSTATAQEDAFIFNIQDVIRQHLSDETFGIAELCQAIGMSRTQLHNKLKALTGQSTSHYVRSIRLHEAKERLAKQPTLNITEIAYETGFSSPNYFARIFAEETGLSPTQFRKNSRAEQ